MKSSKESKKSKIKLFPNKWLWLDKDVYIIQLTLDANA